MVLGSDVPPQTANLSHASHCSSQHRCLFVAPFALVACRCPSSSGWVPLTTISIGIGLLARGGKGATYRKSTLPKEPIEIWGYEASPFVKLAREVG